MRMTEHPLAATLGAALALALIAAAPARAEKADRDKPTNIEANSMSSDDTKRVSIFQGNVLLTKGTIAVRADRIVVTVHVRPRASTAEIVGTHGDAVAVRVTVPPVDGRANAAVTRLIADALEVAPGRVVLVAGAAARTKRFEVHDPDPEALAARLRTRLRTGTGA